MPHELAGNVDMLGVRSGLLSFINRNFELKGALPGDLREMMVHHGDMSDGSAILDRGFDQGCFVELDLQSFDIKFSGPLTRWRPDEFPPEE